MISLLRFKGRRAVTLVRRGAACLMLMMSPLSPWFGLCCGAPCFALAGCCLAPDGLNSTVPTPTCPHRRGEMPITLRGVGSRHTSPSPQNIGRWAAYGHVLRPAQSRNGGHGASPRHGRPSSHLPIRAKRSAPDSRTLPLNRNETIRPRPGARSWPLRQRTPNGCTLSNRLAPLTVPQRTADHPEHTVERGERDSRTNPEKDDARIDNEPFHHEAHTARAVERTRKRNTIAKTHFQSDLLRWVG